jgi:O-antigen/teichoic acid export membrane protein
LVLGQALNFATQLVFITLVARDRRARYPIATATGLVVNVALNVILIPRYDVMGAAAATIVTEVVVIAMLVTALRSFGLRPLPLAALARVGLAATISVATTFAVAQIAPWFVGGLAAACSYVAVLELTGIDGPGGVRGFARRSRDRRRFPVTSPSPSQ